MIRDPDVIAEAADLVSVFGERALETARERLSLALLTKDQARVDRLAAVCRLLLKEDRPEDDQPPRYTDSR